MPAPVLLFTYNRPLHTQRTLEALRNNRLCNESELFIFSDGYKGEEDKADVEEVRRIIRGFDGAGQVYLLENDRNKGLAANIIGGVTRVVNDYGKVIVLEDDLITSPCFLSFMNEALDRFEEEEQIGHIQGYCYPLPALPDAFLIRWTGSWGWATWKRAWQHFNPDGRFLLQQIESRGLARTFDFNGTYPYTRMLRRQVNGENDSWAIRWNASLFLKGILSLNAGKSLVQNIGLDGSGTHSGGDNVYKTDLYAGKPIIRIPSIREDESARRAFERYYIKTNSFWAKVKRRLKRYLKR
ncbi:MAG TPA: glycosyl transferase [Porphyromonadaceae bacterium]|jgi:hypothetical protein|nr:glycosyl transferase [Porphyromonadaceae bacterium]HBL32644.1 glycosyl transferase [Porphyromonadaceae bacterium]HCM20192.1 glycosyl transferase [Porphyromonadaceae bacterium]